MIFNEKLEIIGYKNDVKNDFKYDVFGTSIDPESWYQQNKSTLKVRQLKRKLFNNEQKTTSSSSFLSNNFNNFSDKCNDNNSNIQLKNKLEKG